MKPHGPTLRRAVEFGRQLILTQDLDPVYLPAREIVRRAPFAVSARWLLGYWCFYHVGTACWLAGASREADFWERMERADTERFPRSSERRHFRGHASAKAIAGLKARGSAADIVGLLRAQWTFFDVAEVCKTLPLFGPWATFKVADMLERVDLAHVAFDSAVLGMYDEPQRGAALVMTGELADPRPEYLEPAVEALLDKLGGYYAPPAPRSPEHSRRVGLQEIETVLCKFKSFHKGHYYVGKDIREITHAIQDFPKKTGEELNKYHALFLANIPSPEDAPWPTSA